MWLSRSKDTPNTPSAPAEAESLGLDDFVEPDDQGLSLDELGQAYAALLAKGADPYDEPAGESAPDLLAAEPPPATAEDSACPVTPRSILEAILFVGHPTGEPLTAERIAELMRGVTAGEIHDLIVDLNLEYNRLSAPYAIESIGAGYRLSLKQQFASLRDTFYGRIREARLSAAAIDVLSIVAYYQPVAMSEINRLRGKPSGSIVAQLVRRDLIGVQRPSGERAEPAYCTTSRFLQLFGLQGLKELPRSPDGD